MKKMFKYMKNFFRNLAKIIDRKIITPITKLIVRLKDKLGLSGYKFESWLSKADTLLFISLIISIIVFIAVDQKILVLSQNSAEVLKDLTVSAVYNEESYVIEGLPETVDVTLIGSQSDLYFAKQSPASSISVDLSDLKPGTHKITLKYDQVLSSIDAKVNPSTATIIIYPKVSETRSITYDLMNENKLDSKISVSNVTLSSNEVIIKGAEHTLSKVASIKALINLDNLNTNDLGVKTLDNIPLVAYDENGNIVDVEMLPSTISADINITSPSKEVPIRIIPTGDLAFGYAISSIETNEEKVLVYASEDVLNNLSYIPVYVDVSGLTSSKQFKLAIEKPSGVTALSTNNITVNVNLSTEATRELTDVAIDFKNIKDGYMAQAATADDRKITVILKGDSDVINSISADDITAYVDLSNYEEGTYEVDVTVEGTDVTVSYTAKTKKVNINIIKK